MIKWTVKTYNKKTVPPVESNPLEVSRIRVFCKDTGHEVNTFKEDLVTSIKEVATKEEIDRLDEIIWKFLNDYDFYSKDKDGNICQDFIVILERSDDSVGNIIDI